MYVTYEEFKGRTPIERPGLTIPTRASDFDNPDARRDLGGPDQRFDRGGHQVRDRPRLHRGPRQPTAGRTLGARSHRRAERLLARHPAGPHGRADAGCRADGHPPDAVVLPDRAAGLQALAQVPRGVLLSHRLHARGGDPGPLARVRPDGPGAGHRGVRGGGGQGARARPHARRNQPGGARGDCRPRRRPGPVRCHVHGRRRAGDRRQTAPDRTRRRPLRVQLRHVGCGPAGPGLCKSGRRQRLPSADGYVCAVPVPGTGWKRSA